MWKNNPKKGFAFLFILLQGTDTSDPKKVFGACFVPIPYALTLHQTDSIIDIFD
ncbi:hypothetical protein C943_04344 [Mariniradius saccharolyticus AK6]|uniref:Uncharacterized protein n=1 Tax=Mariniradius saccharolyticus AK6 TaxID=1239962 RepID=M7Y8G2_9BACT|nr:hypothetical protein C943_04344 [Mariniradius saccharolyticus AK6]